MKRIALLIGLIAAIAGTINAQIFYEVSGNGLKQPTYIFGTHHLAPISIIDSISGVRAALDAAEQVVGEIDLVNSPMAAAKAMMPYVMAPSDSTLTTLLPKDRFQALDSVFKSYSGGLSLKLFDQMRPMVATTALTAEIYKKQLKDTGQLDTWIQQQAKLKAKPIIGLETAEFQAEILFTTTTLKQQAEGLVELLENPERSVTIANQITEAYMSQDSERLLALAQEDEQESAMDPKFQEALLEKRNKDWAEKLITIMQNAPTFVAVGALHLYGDVGLVKLLQENGYEVEALR